MSATTEKAILAGGCFWGMQDLIRKRPGVITTRVGYTGGDVANATYRNHGTHAEAIEITFDPSVTSYREILEFFFQIHDPTTKNRQGNDVGLSYRSAIFYVDDEQKRVAEDTIADVEASGLWPGKVVTEVVAGGAVLGGRARAPGLPGALPERVHVPLPSAGLGPAPPQRRARRVGRAMADEAINPAVEPSGDRLRRVPRNGRVVVPPPPLRGMRPHRLLRQLAQPARQQARQGGRPLPSSGASSRARTGSGTTRPSSTTTAPSWRRPSTTR